MHTRVHFRFTLKTRLILKHRFTSSSEFPTGIIRKKKKKKKVRNFQGKENLFPRFRLISPPDPVASSRLPDCPDESEPDSV